MLDLVHNSLWQLSLTVNSIKKLQVQISHIYYFDKDKHFKVHELDKKVIRLRLLENTITYCVK